MGAIKEHYHDTIEKSQRAAAGAPKEKCRAHKWTTDGIDHPYMMCTVCGTLEQKPPDPEMLDDDSDSDDDNGEIFGYECLGCGHIQDGPGECERCSGSAVDPMYF
jgi:hypothetical protein